MKSEMIQHLNKRNRNYPFLSFEDCLWLACVGYVTYLIAKAFHIYDIFVNTMPHICC